jgi:hypothetical protein
MPVGGFEMARKRYSDEECLGILRQVEVELAAGADVVTACRSAGINILPNGALKPLTLRMRGESMNEHMHYLHINAKAGDLGEG